MDKKGIKIWRADGEMVKIMGKINSSCLIKHLNAHYERGYLVDSKDLKSLTEEQLNTVEILYGDS